MNADEQILRYRKDRGLTQNELAERLNVSRSLVAMWESGERIPDSFSVEKMAELFGVKESDIVGNEAFAYSLPEEFEGIKEELKEFTEPDGPSGRKSDEKTVLRKFLDRLSRRDYGIFMGRYFEARTIRALAEKFGCSEAAVRVRLSKIRKKLRSHISKEEKS